MVRLLLVALNFRDLPASDHFESFGWEMGWTARSLATGHGFSSPFWPSTGPTALVCPAFPALLAGIFRIFGLYTRSSAFAGLALNSVFSSMTAVVLYFAARAQFGGFAGRAAGWMWAFYPYGIYYSAVYLWDCALTSLLFACCFALAVTRLRDMHVEGWAGYGVLFGLTALVNPSILTMFPALLGYAAWQRHRTGRPVATKVALSCLALLLTLAPWTVRNLRVMHAPVLLRDGFWLEFWAGNAGDTSQSNPSWAHPASNPAEMTRYRAEGEIAYMAEKHTLAMQQVRSHPVEFVAVSLRRVLRFWVGFWSFSHAYLQAEPFDAPNVPFCAVLTLVSMGGTVHLWRKRRDAALPYVALFLLFPLPYYLTHASTDYRQPIEPEVVLTICYAGCCLRTWRKTRAMGPPGASALTTPALPNA